MQCIVKLLLLLTVTVAANTAKPQNIVEKFVTEKLANYGSWLKSKHLDPSPVIAGPTFITYSSILVKLDCHLSNHIVDNYSEGLNVTGVKANLDYIAVSYEINSKVTFSGRYMGNGTAWYGTELSGNGVWSISVPRISVQDFSMNYSVSDAGYVYITSYKFQGVNMPTRYDDGWDAYFENLWDEGEAAEYEEDIKKATFDGYRSYLTSDLEHPLKTSVLQYFQEIFQNTTWADIIIPSPPEPPIDDKTTSSASTFPAEITTQKRATPATGTGGARTLRMSTVIPIILVLVVFLFD